MEHLATSRQISENSDAAGIEEQLERILSSETFRLPERARRFLRFIVVETLEGRSRQLKAVTIAQLVFDRRHFDPQNDPAVRIEAARIRRELERYYLIAGPGEQWIITIPKGGYVPAFTRAEPAVETDVSAVSLTSPSDEASQSEPEAKPGAFGLKRGRRLTLPGKTWKLAVALSAGVLLPLLSFCLGDFGRESLAQKAPPSIAVHSLELLTDDAVAAKIARDTTDDIITKLAGFKQVAVHDHRDMSEGEAASSITKFSLHGYLRKEDDRIVGSLRLVRQRDSAIVWAEKSEVVFNKTNPFEAEMKIADQVAKAIAGSLPYMIR